MAERFDDFKPFPVVGGLHRADDRLADWSNADESQNVALKAYHAVFEKEPTIDESRHAHCYDQTRRFSFRRSCGRVRRARRKREVRSRNLFKKGLQIGGTSPSQSGWTITR